MRSSEYPEFDSTVYRICGLGQDACHTQIIPLPKKKKKKTNKMLMLSLLYSQRTVRID